MTQPVARHLKAPFVLIASLTLVLAACGGGGGSSAGTSSTMRVVGTAATGAAMANAAVSVTCANGTGSGQTATNGSFSIDVVNGVLPCVLTATSADLQTVLHSVAGGSGASDNATAHITPLSELLVARLAGVTPAEFVAAFSGSTSISTSALSAAQTSLLQMLSATGLNTTLVSDILTGNLEAGTGAGYDGVLDALQIKVTQAGSDLAQLAAAVATPSTSGGDTTAAATLQTALAPADSECPGLKTGQQHLIDITNKDASVIQIDAASLTVTMGNSTYNLNRNGVCDYTLNDNLSTRVLFSRSGLATWVGGSGVNGILSLSLPYQELHLSALAGNYNRLTYSGTNPTFGDFGTVSFDEKGGNSAADNCVNGYGSCAPDPNLDPNESEVVVSSGGSFNYQDNGVTAARIFAFRDGSGRTFAFALEDDGLGAPAFTALIPTAALALPEPQTSVAFWQVSLGATGVSSITSDTTTFVSPVSATNLVTRQFASDGHFDHIAYNNPYPGMRYRATNACMTSSSGDMNCNSAIQVPLPGTGITLVGSADANRHSLSISVTQP